MLTHRPKTPRVTSKIPRIPPKYSGRAEPQNILNCPKIAPNILLVLLPKTPQIPPKRPRSRHPFGSPQIPPNSAGIAQIFPEQPKMWLLTPPAFAVPWVVPTPRPLWDLPGTPGATPDPPRPPGATSPGTGGGSHRRWGHRGWSPGVTPCPQSPSSRRSRAPSPIFWCRFCHFQPQDGTGGVPAVLPPRWGGVWRGWGLPGPDPDGHRE